MHSPALQRWFFLPLMLVAALLPRPAAAQEGVTVDAGTPAPSVAAGSTAAIEVTFTFTNGLHVWPHNPVLPKGLEDFRPIAT
ncbi:MAG: hypothetical protein K2Q09_05000, partial [Phycisphaerales bacterium]|nr:hypothetical protein [Phycisphaerales bacterium]